MEQILDELGEKIEFKKHKILFHDGNHPKGVFKILKGKVKIYACGDDGKEHIIHIASKDEIIGFRAILSGVPYKVSAKTLECCHIQFIKKLDFMEIMNSNTKFRNNIIIKLSRELGDRALLVTTLSQKTVKSRLALSLIQLNEIYNGTITLSREDLANFIGTATENLIRTLKMFKTEKLIHVDGKKIKLLDTQKLNEIGKDLL